MSLTRTVAKKHGVRIYEMANVGNHMHLAIKIGRVSRWAAFIREITGRLALLLRDVMKGEKLWRQRPFTRIVRSWKKAYKNLIAYVELNQWESDGHINRREIKTLKDLELIFGTG